MVAMAVPKMPSTAEAAMPLCMAASPNGSEKKPVKYNTASAGTALVTSARAVICNEEKCDKYLETIFTFMEKEISR